MTTTQTQIEKALTAVEDARRKLMRASCELLELITPTPTELRAAYVAIVEDFDEGFPSDSPDWDASIAELILMNRENATVPPGNDGRAG